jgi:hypothetical protein
MIPLYEEWNRKIRNTEKSLSDMLDQLTGSESICNDFPELKKLLGGE